MSLLFCGIHTVGVTRAVDTLTGCVVSLSQLLTGRAQWVSSSDGHTASNYHTQFPHQGNPVTLDRKGPAVIFQSQERYKGL